MKTRTKSKCAPAPKKSKTVATRVVVQENVPIHAPAVVVDGVVRQPMPVPAEVFDMPDEMPGGYKTDDGLQAIEIALADAEHDVALDAIYPSESNNELLLQVEDMLEELIHTASKSQSSTVCHLAFVLTALFPRLERVSKLADSATFADNSV